jgi:hypothetical protein
MLMLPYFQSFFIERFEKRIKERFGLNERSLRGLLQPFLDLKRLLLIILFSLFVRKQWLEGCILHHKLGDLRL